MAQTRSGHVIVVKDEMSIKC